MAITPADIQAQTFSEAKRGYDPVSYTHLTLPTT